MASKVFKFSFVKVICDLRNFPIICECWISYIELSIYFVKLEWLLKIFEFLVAKVDSSFQKVPTICRCWI